MAVIGEPPGTAVGSFEQDCAPSERFQKSVGVGPSGASGGRGEGIFFPEGVSTPEVVLRRSEVDPSVWFLDSARAEDRRPQNPSYRLLFRCECAPATLVHGAVTISGREMTAARRNGSVDLPAGKHFIGLFALGHGTSGKPASSRPLCSVV